MHLRLNLLLAGEKRQALLGFLRPASGLETSGGLVAGISRPPTEAI
jgi:hypothetical protein